MIQLSVRDNGLGVREEDKSKLFNIFSSIKDPKRNINTKGIGLGLVICKMIVEQFKGRIDFRSVYNRGSTFFYQFELEGFSDNDIQAAMRSELNFNCVPSFQPLEVDRKATFSFIDTYAKFQVLAEKRILVVDDEEFCISTMKMMLKMAGVDTSNQVDFCISGQEALE